MYLFMLLSTTGRLWSVTKK